MATKRKKVSTTKAPSQVSVGDIGKMVGVSSNTVLHWVARDKSFPSPVAHPTSGRLYSKTAVVRWLKKTGRM